MKTKPSYTFFNKINNYLTSLGFTKSEVDANLYHVLVEGNFYYYCLIC